MAFLMSLMCSLMSSSCGTFVLFFVFFSKSVPKVLVFVGYFRSLLCQRMAGSCLLHYQVIFIFQIESSPLRNSLQKIIMTFRMPLARTKLELKLRIHPTLCPNFGSNPHRSTYRLHADPPKHSDSTPLSPLLPSGIIYNSGLLPAYSYHPRKDRESLTHHHPTSPPPPYPSSTPHRTKLYATSIPQNVDPQRSPAEGKHSAHTNTLRHDDKLAAESFAPEQRLTNTNLSSCKKLKLARWHRSSRSESPRPR